MDPRGVLVGNLRGAQISCGLFWLESLLRKLFFLVENRRFIWHNWWSNVFLVMSLSTVTMQTLVLEIRWAVAFELEPNDGARGPGERSC